ncbi:MAG TPA: D-cysteine desulfhydrase family protein [Candidatus Aminicenantes bacterium]|nr:D-cysteine desulfhydrase family protein [Candidatus Aminicenantes bacterium]HRY66180.1 D-cysteine desulfhydrase family protein [Candidatus Aminicenantes bacterium]HRZ73094.1 D-cysteine desulfhydrase family protein [Candidatus Aminicenantes bacterium]
MSNVSSPIRHFREIPKLGLLGSATPVEPLTRLGAELGAARLYIKRDDYSTYLVGGNKARKLEYSMAEVLRGKATAVITVGSVQSNHARITAMVARRLGLKCYLVLNGDLTARPTGNHLITKALGIEIIPVASRQDRLPAMEELAKDLERQGEIVARIPLGASDAVGSFGLTAGMDEIIEQEKALGIRFDAIMVGSSSGGTQAGLEVGKRLFGRSDLRIIGVSPDDPAADIRKVVMRVGGQMLDKIGGAGLNEEDIEIDDAHIGEGYGIPSPASEEAARLFARTEGILLDPVYTSKVGAALIDACRQGRFLPGQNVLFWHTGGLIGLFS